MRHVTFILFWLALLSLPANGADYEKGKEAYARKDYDIAFEEWLPLAEAGHADAQLGIATLFLFGEGVAKDRANAYEWAKKSADQGFSRAQVLLGLLYRNGEGVERNLGLALDEFRKASEQGSAKADYQIAVMLERGWGASQNYDEALRYYRASAEAGFAHAQFALGAKLINGAFPGHKIHSKEGVDWLERASAQSHFAAKRILAREYEGINWQELGAEPENKNLEAAYKLYLELADAGDAFAQERLAGMYMEGIGRERNLIDAYKWFDLAYREYHRRCLVIAAEIESTLSTEELCMDSLRDFPIGRAWRTNFSSDRQKREYEAANRDVVGMQLRRRKIEAELTVEEYAEAVRRTEHWLNAQTSRPLRGENAITYPPVVVSRIPAK